MSVHECSRMILIKPAPVNCLSEDTGYSFVITKLVRTLSITSHSSSESSNETPFDSRQKMRYRDYKSCINYAA